MLRSILPRISGSKKLGFIDVMFSLAYTVVKVFQKKLFSKISMMELCLSHH